MTDNLLDSFLVKLLFSADDQSRKKFDESIASVEKKLAALGAAAAATATGIGFSVKKISESLGDLWYAAQAAQSSAKDMNAFGYAIEQAGGKAGEGAAELKTFTDYVKSTAGQGAFANWFRVPFDVAHPVNSLMVAIDQLSAQWAKGGAAQATAIKRATLMGISPDELIPDRVAKMHKAFDAKLKETGWIDDLSKKSVQLNADFNAITTHLKEMAEQASGPLMSAMSSLLEKTDAWLVKNKDWLVAIGTTFSEGIARNAAATIDTTKQEWQWLIDGLNGLDNKIKQILGADKDNKGVMALVDAFKSLEPLVKRVGDAMHVALEWAMKPLQVIIDALRSMGLISPAEASTGGSAGDLGGGTGGSAGGASAIRASKADVSADAAMIRKAAIDAGVDPDVAVAVAKSEGLGTSYAGGDSGSSFGPFQMHFGGMAGGSNRGAGLGDVMLRETGIDARDPRNKESTIKWALKYAKVHGWGDWRGAARIGVGERQGLGNPLANVRLPMADFHKALDAIRAKPVVPWQQSMNHHDHRVVNSSVAVNVKGGFPVDKTERPLERPKLATFIRNMTAFAS